MKTWWRGIGICLATSGAVLLPGWGMGRSAASPPPHAADARFPPRAVSSVTTSGAAVSATASAALRLAGQFGGISPAVAWFGEANPDLVWVARGPRVLLVDTADPAAPEVVEQSDVLPGIVHALTCVDHVLYSTEGSSWLSMGGPGTLRVWEVTRDERLAQVGELPLPALGMGVSADPQRDRLYVAAHTAGLQILDITDRRRPVLLGTFAPPNRAITAVVPDPDREIVYVGSSWWDAAVDVSDPRAPRLLGDRTAPTGLAFHLALDGTRLFSARLLGGVAVTDMSDPAMPKDLATYRSDGMALGVAVGNDSERLYVADGWTGLHAVDITRDPTESPPLLQVLPLPPGPWDVEAAGDRVYVGAIIAGDVSVVDVAPTADETAPMRLAGVLPSFNGPDGFVVDQGLAYGVAGGDGTHDQLRVLDVSDPAHVRIEGIGATDMLTGTRALAVRKGVVYAASGVNGLQIVDATPPSLPRTVGHLDFLPPALDVAVAGSVVLVARGGAGLLRVDVADMTAPRAIGTVGPGDSLLEVEVQDDIAFVLSADDLSTYDASRPERLVPLGGLPLPILPGRSTEHLAVSGRRAAITCDPSGVILLDVSDVRQPRMLGTIDLGSGVRSATFVDDRTVVATDDTGVRAIDVSDPTDARKIGAYLSDLDFRGVTVASGTIYAPSDVAGVYTFSLRHGIHVPVALRGTRW
jgi:hypothetical protein